MRLRIILICLLGFVACHSEHASTSGLKISSENSNYYEFNGQPTLIVSATEHYFSVVNSKFDYPVYLSKLHSLGFNMATVMSGTFLEPSGQGEWEELVLPWRRSNEEGFHYGGNKFDLSQWDDAYFDRLEKFVSTANSKNIFVKYIFFAPIFDNHKWSGTPFNPANNVNSAYAQVQPKGLYTLDKHQGLLNIQKELIDKVTATLSKYPNVLYEVTFNGDPHWVDYDWYRFMHNYLLEQMPEPKKPVVFNMGIVPTPENFSGVSEEKFIGNPVGRRPIPECFSGASGISYMYTGDKQLAHIVGKGLPVLHAESCFRPNWEPHVRQHAYRTLLSGAGAYTFADFTFSARYPDGNKGPNPRAMHGGGPDIHHSLSAVSKTLNSINFIRMHPNHSLVSFKNSELEAVVLAQNGHEYLAYISPKPAPESYKVVFKGFIKPSTEGWHNIKAQANSTMRFVLGYRELIDNTEYQYRGQSVTGKFYYDGRKPIPFELESKLNYYGNETGLYLEDDSLHQEAITYEQLLCTDAVTKGVEATYYTGAKLDEKMLWRIEKKVEHRGVCSPFFNEDQIHKTSFDFTLPAGEYNCQWIDTKTASVINEFTIQHSEDGEYRFHTPAFVFDILLKINRK